MQLLDLAQTVVPVMEFIDGALGNVGTWKCGDRREVPRFSKIRENTGTDGTYPSFSRALLIRKLVNVPSVPVFPYFPVFPAPYTGHS